MFADKKLGAIMFLLTYWRRVGPVFAGRWGPDNGCGALKIRGIVCQHINVDAGFRVFVCVCLREC